MLGKSCIGTLGLFKSIHKPIIFTHTCSHCCFHEHTNASVLCTQTATSVSHGQKRWQICQPHNTTFGALFSLNTCALGTNNRNILATGARPRKPTRNALQFCPSMCCHERFLELVSIWVFLRLQNSQQTNQMAVIAVWHVQRTCSKWVKIELNTWIIGMNKLPSNLSLQCRCCHL